MASYTTNELGVDRRRRLFSSLRSILPDHQLWDALWLWEREFAEQAPFAISDYAQRLAQQLGAPGSVQSLLDQVTQGIQGSAEGLPGDPIEQMLQNNGYDRGAGGAVAAPAAAAAAAPPTISLSPESAVFNALVSAILQSMERKEPGSEEQLRRYLGTQSSSVSGAARAALAGWARGELAELAGASKADMAGLINVIYVWACEEVGPTTVDRIFGDAMRTAEALPESGSFSPRQLF